MEFHDKLKIVIEEIRMKKLIGNLKSGNLIASFICLILGGFILFLKDASFQYLSQMIGAVLIAHGLITAVFHFWQNNRTMLDNIEACIGLVVAAVGLWVVISPDSTIAIIPILLALFIILHSLQDMALTWKLKKAKDEQWKLMSLLSALVFVLGLLLLMHPAFIQKFIMFLTAITLLYDGALSFYLWMRIPNEKENIPTEIESITDLNNLEDDYNNNQIKD